MKQEHAGNYDKSMQHEGGVVSVEVRLRRLGVCTGQIVFSHEPAKEKTKQEHDRNCENCDTKTRRLACSFKGGWLVDARRSPSHFFSPPCIIP